MTLYRDDEYLPRFCPITVLDWLRVLIEGGRVRRADRICSLAGAMGKRGLAQPVDGGGGCDNQHT
jgi:hypothetical protein